MKRVCGWTGQRPEVGPVGLYCHPIRLDGHHSPTQPTHDCPHNSSVSPSVHSRSAVPLCSSPAPTLVRYVPSTPPSTHKSPTTLKSIDTKYPLHHSWTLFLFTYLTLLTQSVFSYSRMSSFCFLTGRHSNSYFLFHFLTPSCSIGLCTVILPDILLLSSLFCLLFLMPVLNSLQIC